MMPLTRTFVSNTTLGRCSLALAILLLAHFLHGGRYIRLYLRRVFIAVVLLNLSNRLEELLLLAFLIACIVLRADDNRHGLAVFLNHHGLFGVKHRAN